MPGQLLDQWAHRLRQFETFGRVGDPGLTRFELIVVVVGFAPAVDERTAIHFGAALDHLPTWSR